MATRNFDDIYHVIVVTVLQNVLYAAYYDVICCCFMTLGKSTEGSFFWNYIGALMQFHYIITWSDLLSLPRHNLRTQCPHNDAIYKSAVKNKWR